MKKLIILSTSLLLVVTSCIKGLPVNPTKGPPIVTPPTDTLVVRDSSYYKILCASVTNTSAHNDCVVYFTSKAHNAYVQGEDAPFFMGFGIVQSWTMADTVALAVNEKIYQRNIPTKFVVSSKVVDNYTFSITDHVLPVGIHVWLVGKDSVDIATTPYTIPLNSGISTFKIYVK